MRISKLIGDLENSPEFKDWKHGHKSSFLCSAFLILGGSTPEHWMIGYYSKEKDTIATFEIGDVISIKEDCEVLRKPNVPSTIKEVKMNEVKVDYIKAIETAAVVKDKNYSKESIGQTVLILQHIPIGLVWNVTCITQAYNTLNVKIDAGNGKVLEHKLSSVFEFQKK